MGKIIVIGGGAAGMMAAAAAAEHGGEVVLCEKNEKLGKKLFITGKGRCNVTNHCDMEALFGNVVTNGKFLYSAFYFSFLYQQAFCLLLKPNIHVSSFQPPGKCTNHIRGVV